MPLAWSKTGVNACRKTFQSVRFPHAPMNQVNPMAVISRPTRFSGRRRRAINPVQMYATPTTRST
jgi:hypothetical protein